MSDLPSFRVGIVGLCPVGRFLLERLLLIPHCQPVLFQYADVEPDKQATSLGLASISDWERFLAESELKAVLFLDGYSLSFQQVKEAFQAGFPVGILPPLACETTEWQALLNHPQKSLFLLNPHLEDPDFRAAMACVESGELGRLSAIKRASWVGELVVPPDTRPVPEDHWLPQLLWEDVDQLLRLAGQLPNTVYAADFTQQPASYLLIFQFPSGLVGHLERRRGAAVPLDQGWRLSSQSGGCANGQRHIKTEAGELYEVPVELATLLPQAWFDPLQNRSASADDEAAVLNVLNVLAAISQSAKTRQAVGLFSQAEN
jgi:predicted dehydrogenase